MKPIEYAVLTDKQKPQGFKEWVIHLLYFFALGFIFGLFKDKE